MENTIKKQPDFITSRVVKTSLGYGLFIIGECGRSRTYPDITTDFEKLCTFSDKLNDGEVSPLHIDDIIEDMLE